MIKKVIQVLVPLGLAGALLWWVLKDTDFEQLKLILEHTNYALLALSALPMLGAHLARAQRWRLLLEPVAVKPALWESFAAVMAGYVANLALPRLGEVTRCTMLLRRRGISVEVSLGTVIAERAFDVLMLGVITALSFWLEYDKVLAFFQEILALKKAGVAEAEPSNNNALLAFAGLLILVAIAAYILREKLLKVAIIGKIYDFAMGMLAGVFSVFKLRSPGGFLLHTVLIWVGYFLSTWLALVAVPGLESIGGTGTLLILTVGSFGMIVPVQGGYGPYEFMVIAGLTKLYGFEKVLAEAGALLMHNSQTLIVVLVGAACFAALLGAGKAKALGEKAV
jgi:uncharacterized membrane protein YbhN (UPF0104 family)